MANLIDLEELSLEGLNPEIVEKALSCTKYPFPAVTLSGGAIFFNKHAAEYGMVPKFIRWMTTPEYVIGLPAPKMSKDAFAARSPNSSVPNMVTHFPINLKKEKRVQEGTYKLLKCKDGFAFKRYERLEKK